jgi:molecular chaperone HscC
VALGAAVQAGLIGRQQSVEDLVVTDVCPFTLGVEVSKKFGHERRTGYFLPVINRNTTIPVSRVETLSTVDANQTEIKCKIYQGESRRVSENLLLGEFAVKGIPRAPAGEQSLDVRFTYDLNGVLEVEATVLETGNKVSHVVTRYAKGLRPDQIAQAVEQVRQLKTHPREETVNRFLLRRAERIYQELSIDNRESLSMLLDGFESALDLQDADSIDRHRTALERFLDRYDTGFDDSTSGNDDDDWYQP